METIDKKRIVEHTHRYYKLNLKGVYTIANTDGTLRFTIPPPNSSGFAFPSKNECLMKIRKVYIGRFSETGQETAPIGYGVFESLGTGTAVFGTSGLTLNTSIMSHNSVFGIGQGNGFNGMTQEQSTKAMLGCMLPPRKFQYVVPTLGDNAYLVDEGSLIYEDFSKIEDSGTLCNNPFGNEFQVWLSETHGYKPIVPVLTAPISFEVGGGEGGGEGEGLVIDDKVELSIELEVMTL
jgi:hypothetical protein